MRRISSLVRWQKAYQVRRGNSFTTQLLEKLPTCTAVLLPTWYLPSETKKKNSLYRKITPNRVSTIGNKEN